MKKSDNYGKYYKWCYNGIKVRSFLLKKEE